MSNPDERRDVLRELNRAANHFTRVMRPGSGATTAEKVDARERLRRAREAAREMRRRAAERRGM
jgi:hypothetical protein